MRVVTDLSLWGVVLGNALSAYMAFAQNWDLGELMWVFWAQSVIIGIANILRMLSLKDFSTQGFKSGDKQIPETRQAQIETVGFFALHYGFFHFIYALFLWDQMALTSLNADHLFALVICVVGFMAAHFYSLSYNFAGDFKDKKPNLGTLMFYPYMRIIPMHLTILAGAEMGGYGALAVFLALKALADVGMHLVERRLFRKTVKDLTIINN